MDLSLRLELGVKERRDGTLITPDTTAPPKAGFKSLGGQLLTLIIFISLCLAAIAINRRRQEYEQIAEKAARETEGIPLQGIVKTGTISTRYGTHGDDAGDTVRLVSK